MTLLGTSESSDIIKKLPLMKRYYQYSLVYILFGVEESILTQTLI